MGFIIHEDIKGYDNDRMYHSPFQYLIYVAALFNNNSIYLYAHHFF